MEHTYWYKQSTEPLFADIIWSRPETKTGAGKLLIIGGNRYGFSAPGNAYSEAVRAGVGVSEVVLPDAVQKVVKVALPDALFAPTTPSGSFALETLAEIDSRGQWSDAVLLAGDFGRNSETAVLLERFLERYKGLLVITQDAVDYFRETPRVLVDRERTCVVLSLSQLQKLFISTPTITPILLSMTTQQLVEALKEYTVAHPAIIMTKHNDLLFVAHGGLVSTTKFTEKIWRVRMAAWASVFWLQNASKPFESITTAVFASSREVGQE